MDESRAANPLIWVVIAGCILLFQLFVHGVFNSQAVSIFPTDGCGQVLDVDLMNLLELLLRAAMLSSLSFSVLLTFARSSKVWNGILLLSGIVAITGFVFFGWINWQYRDFLTACDIFFMNRKAAPWNLFAAILVLVSCYARLKHLRKAD